MWYIVRDEETMRYIIKTADLFKAMQVRDERRAAGESIRLLGKPKGFNQIQTVSLEQQAAMYEKKGVAVPEWIATQIANRAAR